VQTMLEVLLFILCIVICFFLPGKFINNRLGLKLDGIEALFIATVTGVVFFIFSLYLLSWVHAEWIIIPIVLIIDFFALKNRKRLSLSLRPNDIVPLVLIGVSGLIFSLPLLAWGIYNNHIAYRFDDLWHLALIQEMKVNFPPGVPTFAGVGLRGYHFFTDFLQANISNIFSLSPFSLHFHLFPVFLSLLWALGAYSFMYTWTKKRTAGLWAVFLTMFGGSFAYLFPLFGRPAVSLSDGLSILQPAISIFNPPSSFSIVLLFFCLFLLYHYLQKQEKRWMIPFIIAAGILPMVKVYAGIILFGGLAPIVFYELWQRRFFLFQACLVIGLIVLGTYWIFVGGTGGLIWYPLWPPHELLRSFSWYGYDERMYTFTHEGVIKGLIKTELFGFSLFFLGNLGTRIFGLFSLVLLLKKRIKLNIFPISLIVMMVVSILIPLLFIQTGKVFEIIQMATYYLLFCSLFASIGLTAFFSLHFRFHRIVKAFILLIFIFLTIPSAFYTYSSTIKEAKNTKNLTDPYYTALLFLRNHGEYNQTVLALPDKSASSSINDLNSWYKTSDPTVSVFTNKRMYLANGGIDFPGMDYKARISSLSAVLQDIDSNQTQKVDTFLRENHITYIFSSYQLSPQLLTGNIKEIYHATYYVYQFLPKH
jgi:hypothetical protein